MEITTAAVQMIPKLKIIWEQCFGDKKEYIDFYFQHRFSPEIMIAAVENDSPVAMLSLLPTKLYKERQSKILHYVYGVATLPEYQKRGIAKRLLEYAGDFIEQESRLFLVPANKSLFSYYRKQQFESAFYLKHFQTEVELDFIEETEWTKTAISPEEYKQIRDNKLKEITKKDGYVEWDLFAISYALNSSQLIGGMTCKIISQFGEDILLFHIDKEKKIMEIEETTLDGEALLKIGKTIAKQYDCQYLSGRLPIQSVCQAEQYVFGLAKQLPQIGNGYFNLALD